MIAIAVMIASPIAIIPRVMTLPAITVTIVGIEREIITGVRIPGAVLPVPGRGIAVAAVIIAAAIGRVGLIETTVDVAIAMRLAGDIAAFIRNIFTEPVTGVRFAFAGTERRIIRIGDARGEEETAKTDARKSEQISH